MISNKVYILLLNYNGWHHTIECLESLLKLNYPNYQIVVIDNNSSDNSVDHVLSWAEGRLNVWLSDDKPLKRILFPTITGAIPHIFYSKNDAEKGGNAVKEGTMANNGNDRCNLPIVVIQAEKNLGFAGGNNIGLRYVISKGDSEYVWLINNDTVVRRDTLTHLILKISEKNQIGAVGSVQMDYFHPETILTVGGGKYYKYLGLIKFICKNKKYTTQLIDGLKETIKIDFLSGCSMLLKRDVLTRVGLLDEDYFMYWEDADWSERIKNEGFLLACALKSVVYHKYGQSSSSFINAYYGTLNCFKFYRKYHPTLLPLVLFTRLAFVFVMTIKERNVGSVKGALKAYAAFFKSIIIN